MSDEVQKGRFGSVQIATTSSNKRLNMSLKNKDLEKIKSQVRSCVMHILTDRLTKPAVFSETNNALIAELIVEYLDWMGYNHTSATFQVECQLPQERNVAILDELCSTENNESMLPRIFLIVSKFKDNTRLK